MSDTTITQTPIKDIKIREGLNARINGGGINDLAESIKLLGVLVPLIIDREGYLVAGHRRLHAATDAGLDEVPTIWLRDQDEAAGVGVSAAENIARQQLTPAEEATAIERMLKAGYTPEGAAQALAMPLARVRRRQQLLTIPEPLRSLWGPDGEASASTVPNVAEILEKVPAIAPAMHKAHVARREKRAGLHIDEAGHDPHRYLRGLYGAMAGRNFSRIKGLPKPGDFIVADQHSRLGSDDLSAGKQRKRYAEIENKVKKANLYGDSAYLRIAEADVDAARAAGVTLHIDGPDKTDAGIDLIVSRSWLTAHAGAVMLDRWDKQVDSAIKRGRSTTGHAKGESPRARQQRGEKLTPQEAEQAARDIRERETEKRWKGLARGANLDLGQGLLDRLSELKVITPEIARFFAVCTLGNRPTKHHPPAGSDYYIRERPGARLAAAGLRYALADWQTEVPTPTKADPAKTRIDYLPIDEAERRLWKWFDQAKTAGEILGRTLIIHATALWAFENMLPRSQQQMASHRNQGGRYVVPYDAAQILEKITRSSVPPSVRKLAREMRDFNPAADPDQKND